MKKYTNKISKIVMFLSLALLVGFTAVYAADKLTPSGSVSNTMYSLTDIWNLATGTTTTEGTGTIETTPSTVSATGKTLTEVYTAIKDQLTLLTTDKIAKNEVVFGKTGALYGDTDPSKVLTTATYPGTATAGTPAPTFASADQTSYNCSSFTTMTDPTQPSITSADICEYNSGCSWNAGTSQCDGGEQTGQTYMTWYAAKASCSASTEGGQTAGTWRLPTYGELVNHYVDNNIAGGAPTGFQSDFYWSGTTYPGSTVIAYYVFMYDGNASYSNKYYPNFLAHCAH